MPGMLLGSWNINGDSDISPQDSWWSKGGRPLGKQIENTLISTYDRRCIWGPGDILLYSANIYWAPVLYMTFCSTLKTQWWKSQELFLPNIHWKDRCWSSNTLVTWYEEPSHWKRLWCWERLKAGGEADDRGWDCWVASPTQWTPVWANFRK